MYSKKMLELLEKKLSLFDEYKNLTLALKEKQREDIEYYITMRGNIAIKIDNLSKEIEQMIESEVGEHDIRAIISCKYDRGDVPEEWILVYDKCLEIINIISIIKHTDEYILCDMKCESANLIEKIKASSNTPKITKYLNNLSSKGNATAHNGSIYSKV